MTGTTGTLATDPLLGTTVGERYVIARELGRGGMGVVYAATQRDLEREVAIKVLFQTGDPSSEERLLREARAAGSIGHPNVVDVYDLGRLSDGRSYVVMPLLDGRDLATELGNVGLVTAERGLWILTEAARGLDVLHAKGLVHRDLKPENLFLVSHADGTEALKILDFGLATRVEDVRLTHTGFTSGSPHYMAPEAADGTVPDRRGDVYSLASVAYELLSGRTAFDGESPFAILTQKTTLDAPRLGTSERPFPSEVEAVMARGLARYPEARYASAGAFVAALAQAFRGVADDDVSASARRRTLEVESPLFAPAPAPEPAPERAKTAPVELTVRKTGPSGPPPALPTRRGPVIALAIVAVLALGGGIVALVANPRGEQTPAARIAAGAPPVTTPGAIAAPQAPTVPPPPRPSTPIAVAPSSGATDDPVANGHARSGSHRPNLRAVGRETPTPSATPPTPTPVFVTAQPAPAAASPVPVPPAETPFAAREPRPDPRPDPPDVARATELTRAATRMLVQGALGDALAQFRAATLAAPRHAPAWRGFALANERLGRNPEAVRAYSRYLDLASSAPDAEEIRARIARLSGG